MSRPFGFSRSRRGVLRLRVDTVERGLLISLAQQMVDFVAPEPMAPDADPLEVLVGIDADAQQPDDPALARLFPDAYRDDPEAAHEFRRFTERGLREAKAANATAVLRALEGEDEEIVVDDDAVSAWLGFLNDTRLALGTRLEITEDSHEALAALPDDDPRSGAFHVYDWLTYLQDSLVHLLLS